MDITNNLQQQLQQLVYEIETDAKEKRKELFTVPTSNFKKLMLTIPSLLAVLLHWPLYLPVLKLVSSKAFHSVHYDSIMVGMLFVLYPFYLLLLCLLTYFLTGGFWWIATLFVVPFCAWSYIQLKKQTD